MGNRGFKKVEKFKDIDFNLPTRSTKNSAGYDFEIPVDVEILPNEVKTIATGVKAYMENDEVLELYNRSSNAKKGLIMPHSVGIVDSDYYNNPENEGEIIFVFKNTTDKTYNLKKGDRIGQGIFKKFLTIDNEAAITNVRTGGFGSTNKKGITLMILAATIIILITLASTVFYLAVYNIEQSKKNILLSEIQTIQNSVLETINISKVEGNEINASLKVNLLTGIDLANYESYLLSSRGDFYILTRTELSIINLVNVPDNQEFIVNWETGEVLNKNIHLYKDTIIRAEPVLE